MKVIEMTTNTFWKGELGVKGLVEENENQYNVSLYVKGSQINDYSCSCAKGNSYKGMCAHAKALFEAFQSKKGDDRKRVISTSQEVRTMIREYTNREVAAIMEEDEEEPVEFIPRLTLGRRDMRLQFKVGRSRQYLIKDLAAFARNVQAGAYVEYGKNMAFHHNLNVFVPESRSLVEFVLEQVNLYMEHYDLFKRGSFSSPSTLKEMELNQTQRDAFFSLMLNKTLEVEDTKGIKHVMRILNENPDLKLCARKEGQGGIRIWMPEQVSCFCGEHHLYLSDGAFLYRSSQEYKAVMQVFLEQVMNVPGNTHELLVHEHDIPLFYERVLKKVSQYSSLDAAEIDFEAYRPKELNASFYFDSNGSNEITMRPTLSYGDFSFHPVEDEKLPRTVCRDVPGEFKISRLITKYFKYKEGDLQSLVIRDDEDEMYRLLTEGMSEFMDAGEVLVSDTFRQMKILPSPKVSFGVSMSGGWLWLDIDAGEMSGGELNRILSEYSRKKTYFRMKNGQFLTLDDSGFLAVADLAERLSITKGELQDKRIKLPGYRALYLDSLLKEDAGILRYRDQLFKAVIRGMKSVDDSEFDIPDSMNDILRLYQKKGYYWLKTLAQYGFGGILADDMGLGKTIQMLSVLLDEKEKGQALPSLIICPASLVYNWESEIHHFTPSLRAGVLAGTAKEREELLVNWMEYDVLVTSYDLLKRDIILYKDMEFRFQIIDEAQYIKNAATQSARAVKAVRAQLKFALTGTPIENRLAELWSIFDYLMPGFLFGYQKFKKDYELPIMKGEENQAAKHLKMLISPFVLRRLKKDVLKELPDKLETVVYSKMQGEQKDVYTAHAANLKQSLLKAGDGDYGSDKLQILAALTKLRQICCDPRLCFEQYTGDSAKLDTCLELVQNAIEGGHKILLFSQFTSMLELIAKELKKQEIPYYTLMGSDSKEQRQQRVNEFQKNDVPVFLISLKAGGTGLNLTAADVVIHYDPWWNVAAQNQATDRTHRIGQEKQVSVFKLITSGTIEENIVKLQKMKEDLANQIITEGAVSLSSLTKEDLIKLLDETNS